MTYLLDPIASVIMTAGIATGQPQAQYILSTMLGTAKSAATRRQWPEARNEQDRILHLFAGIQRGCLTLI